jgi:hypothetical protein
MQLLDCPTPDFITLPPEGDLDMATAAELTTTVATLAERVTNHIRFFWVVVTFSFTWLGVITGLLIQTKGTIDHVAQSQANTPAQIVASLLNKPAASRDELVANLNAVSTILQASKPTLKRPDPSVVKNVAAKLSDVQQQYPDLPQVWQSTGAFINYKSVALTTAFASTGCTEALRDSGWVLSNCEVHLEDLIEGTGSGVVNGVPVSFVFINCIVRYKGGPLRGPRRLTFINCDFRFNITTIPPREGMRALRQLTMASTDSPIELSLG